MAFVRVTTSIRAAQLNYSRKVSFKMANSRRTRSRSHRTASPITSNLIAQPQYRQMDQILNFAPQQPVIPAPQPNGKQPPASYNFGFDNEKFVNASLKTVETVKYVRYDEWLRAALGVLKFPISSPKLLDSSTSVDDRKRKIEELKKELDEISAKPHPKKYRSELDEFVTKGTIKLQQEFGSIPSNLPLEQIISDFEQQYESKLADFNVAITNEVRIQPAKALMNLPDVERKPDNFVEVKSAPNVLEQPVLASQTLTYSHSATPVPQISNQPLNDA